MTESTLEYDLHNGYVHNWLVVGPQRLPIADDPHPEVPQAYADLVEAYASSAPGIPIEPVEPATLTDGVVEFTEGEEIREGRWRYVRCREDHFVDLSEETGVEAYLRTWAYAELSSPTAQSVRCTLTTTGSADVWLNGDHVHRQVPEPHEQLTQSFSVALEEGPNTVLVRYDLLATKTRPYVMALHVASGEAQSHDAELMVTLPTRIAPLSRRTRFETVFEAAHLKQYVFTRLEEVTLSWPAEKEVAEALEKLLRLTIRIQTPSGRVYAETARDVEAGSQEEVKPAYKYPNGALEALLMPTPKEYYEGNMRITRRLRFWGLDNNRHTETPFGTFPERRETVLLAAARRVGSLFAEIAKMAVGWWSRLEPDVIVEAAARIAPRRDPPLVELLALLGVTHRFGDDEAFPDTLREPLAAAARRARFRSDEAASPESQALLTATCQILAGQLYPQVVFSASGETGQRLREAGEEAALAWLRAKARTGFDQWDSDLGFAETMMALSYLIDLAEADAVWEMATVMMDKMLFQLAVNSYKGVFGSTRGRTSAASLLGGYLEATSGISKLMWGMGVLNFRLPATVSLALMESYELPVMLQTIAADLPDALWSREHHGNENGVDKVTYKTPDYMLAAAQDYHPGEPGGEEHIWQATLGPGATVFVNHPGCASLDDAHRPNFWRGNVILPRVAQWQDALTALYRVPEDDWMGFTHAYFPVHAFDAYTIRDGWAFARKGEGYLALTASQGFNFVERGPSAYRELRSYGRDNVWLCQMGRAALDGSFETFQEKVLALPVSFEELGVRWTTLRGDELALDWTGPFVRNGEAVTLEVNQHIENPYCVAPFPASQMDVIYGDTAMRLTFEET